AYRMGGRGDLVLRGGLGVFYDQINLNPFLDFRPPITASQGIQGNPVGATPVSTYGANFCGQAMYQWDAIQVPGLVCPPGTVNAGQVNTAGAIFPGVEACSDPNCAAPTDAKGLSAYSVSPNFRTPYFFNYNLQAEKSFGNVGMWQIGYVGSGGRKLNVVSNINQSGAFPNFGNVLQLNTAGTSNYNALQTVFRIRARHGVNHKFSAANGGTLWVNPAAFCDPNAGDPGCTGSTYGNLARNKFYGPNFKDVDLSVIKNIPIKERLKLQLRADIFNTFNRINLASGPGSVAVGGRLSPNYNTCTEDLSVHHCSSAGGFGMVSDTIGDFSGAPGLGPGEEFNMQLVIKLIF